MDEAHGFVKIKIKLLLPALSGYSGIPPPKLNLINIFSSIKLLYARRSIVE